MQITKLIYIQYIQVYLLTVCTAVNTLCLFVENKQ